MTDGLYCAIIVLVEFGQGWAGGIERILMYDETMPKNIEDVADRVLARQKFGGIVTVREYPVLGAMYIGIRYTGELWTAIRRQVDQLDQVTFGRRME